MNHACINCGHQPDKHEGGGCVGDIDTFWGVETCGCSSYEADTE